MQRIFTPHPALQPYIRFYQYAELGEENQWTMQSLVASPDPTMVLVTEKDAIDFKEDGQRKTYESIALLGPLTQYKETALKNKVKSLWIAFRPCGIAEIFRLHTKAYVNQCVNFTDLPGSKIGADKEKMTAQKEPGKIVEQVEKFLLNQLCQNNESNSHRQLCYALEQLKAQCHKKNIISAVCKQTGYSIKSFERHTLKMTGICPKQFQRIVRFNRTLKSVLQRKEASWAQTAYEFGYSDQTHFIREFKSFYGKTPGTISSDDGVMKHMFHPETAAL